MFYQIQNISFPEFVLCLYLSSSSYVLYLIGLAELLVFDKARRVLLVSVAFLTKFITN